MLFSRHSIYYPIIALVHSDHDDNTPTVFLSHSCIKEPFSLGETNLILLSFPGKEQRKGSAINETGTWVDSDSSVTGCVKTGVNMVKGSAGNFFGSIINA